MSDTLSKALSAVAEALANPPPPEQVNAETACQMLEAMDKLHVMLEPSNLRILNLSAAVRSEPELEDGKTTIWLTNFTNSLMLWVPLGLPKEWVSLMSLFRQRGPRSCPWKSSTQRPKAISSYYVYLLTPTADCNKLIICRLSSHHASTCCMWNCHWNR